MVTFMSFPSLKLITYRLLSGPNVMPFGQRNRSLFANVVTRPLGVTLLSVLLVQLQTYMSASGAIAMPTGPARPSANRSTLPSRSILLM